MTPPAMTTAGRTTASPDSTRDQPRPGRGRAGSPGHGRSIRRDAAPRSPRRVSGPTGGRAATVRPAQPARRQPRRRTSAASNQASLPLRAAAVIRGLPDHPLLDRAVRGRAWIPLLGVMLAGIVAMQVEVLKLGASMGRAIDQANALQSRNDLLRASVASLADDQRIERLAAAQGMVMPAPDAVGFLFVHRGDIARATGTIHAPNASAFLSLLTSNGAVATTATPPGALSGSAPPNAISALAPGTAQATTAQATAAQATTAQTTTAQTTTTPSTTAPASTTTLTAGASTVPATGTSPTATNTTTTATGG
jgi:hypothetical protein